MEQMIMKRMKAVAILCLILISSSASADEEASSCTANVWLAKMIILS